MKEKVMFLTTRDLPSLYPNGARLDRVFNEFFNESFNNTGVNKYPATDVYTEDDVTYIEVAVTGFSESDISVYLDNNVLTIEGAKEVPNTSEHRKYYSRNIAKRSFKRQYTVTDRVEDVKASITDGLLKLELIEKPEVDTKKVIKITT